MKMERPEGIIVTFPVQYLYELGLVLSDNWSNKGNEVLHMIQLCSKKFKDRFQFTRDRKSLIKLGYLEFQRQWRTMMNDDEMVWYVKIGNKPKIIVEYAYITVLNKIRYKACIDEIANGGEVTFDDGRTMTARYWLILRNPIIKTPPIPFKGCQGFRYTQRLN